MNVNRQTAEALEIAKEQLPSIFAYAAQKYESPKQKKPLSGIAREFFEVLFVEEHTTMREFEEHKRTMAGRDSATVRRSITTLERRGLPVQRQQVTDDKGVNPIQYTRYYLTPEFKTALAAEAREQQSQIEAPSNTVLREKKLDNI